MNERTLMSEGFEFLHQAQTVDSSFNERCRLPRLLPSHLIGLKCLENHQVQEDLRVIQKDFMAFESKMAALLLPPLPTTSNTSTTGMTTTSSIDGHELFEKRFDTTAPLLPAKRRPKAGSDGIFSPEQIIATLPGCRRAVCLTRRELIGLKKEHDDLERDFMRMRCTFMWQLGEIKRLKRQQDQIMCLLKEKVMTKAKTLESSKRRTSALQDIMTELETRGRTIIELTRQNQLLHRRIVQIKQKKEQKEEEEEEEDDDLMIGDRVKIMIGKQAFGIVQNIHKETKQVTVIVEEKEKKILNREQIELALTLPGDQHYVEKEKKLKQDLFDKIGMFLQSHQQQNHEQAEAEAKVKEILSDAEESDESVSESDKEGYDSEEDCQFQFKKIKRSIPNPREKLIDFTACKIPIVPNEVGLLLSPLSELPEKVAAIGPGALQWMTQFLPKKMQQWEKEKYEALEMKGEIERLRFQLSKAIEEKKDAQQQAADHLESIDELVMEMEKLREKIKESGLQQDRNNTNKKNSIISTSKNHRARSESK
jgi:hypothetical protein